MEKEDIVIRKIIVHILDSAVGIPALSDSLLESGIDFYDFIREHIYKIVSSDELKSCTFDTQDSFLYQLLTQYSPDELEQHFIFISQQISNHLYTIMNENISIPPADFFVITYQMQGNRYLALLKMNYKETYVHTTGRKEEIHINSIIKQSATLPSSGTKLSEAVLISLSDYSVQIVEKKYEINGKKRNYLSELFLQCQTSLSQKTKLNLVTKAVEQINEKYFDNNIDKKMEIKSKLLNEVNEQGSINIEKITKEIYGDIPEIKEEFTEKLEKYHIETEEITPQNKQTTKKLEKQLITTDVGIEINIPMEEYNNTKNIEFITNSDGSVSILIKNINSITAK